MRSEEYIHLKYAITATDGQLSELGKMVVLPSSFTGGSRYMHKRAQDAMPYVRHFGWPDLFITFTCNPNGHVCTLYTPAIVAGRAPYNSSLLRVS
ncbi:ATP-dependent DNA helicase [Trichonephila clavipes]|nr:ATP-dependent DNA helicase [Trichonephila clavipes]